MHGGVDVIPGFSGLFYGEKEDLALGWLARQLVIHALSRRARCLHDSASRAAKRHARRAALLPCPWRRDPPPA